MKRYLLTIVGMFVFALIVNYLGYALLFQTWDIEKLAKTMPETVFIPGAWYKLNLTLSTFEALCLGSMFYFSIVKQKSDE